MVPKKKSHFLFLHNFMKKKLSKILIGNSKELQRMIEFAWFFKRINNKKFNKQNTIKTNFKQTKSEFRKLKSENDAIITVNRLFAFIRAIFGWLVDNVKIGRRPCAFSFNMI